MVQGTTKIAFVSGASDRPETALVLGLVKRGFPIQVIAEPGGRLAEAAREAGCLMAELTCRSRFDLRAIASMRRLYLRHGVSHVHACTNRTLSCSLLASWGLGIPHIAYRGTAGHVSRFDPTAWFSYLHPRVRTISCVSEAVRDSLRAVVGERTQLAVIRKGHDPAWYHARPRADLAAFGISATDFVVSCVANARPVKGLDVLLEACESLWRRGAENLKLVLIGELRDPSLRRAIEQSPWRSRIITPGFLSDAPAWVGATDIFVMPSRAREGLPKAVIEALSVGVPVVGSDVGGIPEIVKDQVQGLLVRPGDAGELAEAIGKLMTDHELREQLARHARTTIIERFSVDATVDGTAALYGQL